MGEPGETGTTIPEEVAATDDESAEELGEILEAPLPEEPVELRYETSEPMPNITPEEDDSLTDGPKDEPYQMAVPHEAAGQVAVQLEAEEGQAVEPGEPLGTTEALPDERDTLRLPNHKIPWRNPGFFIVKANGESGF